MKLVLAVSLTFVATTFAIAAETKLSEQAIRTLLSDATLVSSDGGRPTEQVFQASGLTFTVDVATKAQSLGKWRIENDQYCSVWPPSEHWSCYEVFSTSEGVVFVSSDGTRYEMKKPQAN